MQNPYPNPLAGRSGNTHELLASLTPAEIRQYVLHYRWEQANMSFPDNPKSVYKSKAYYMYRTNQWMYDAQKVLAEQGEIKSDGSEVIDHEE